MLPCGRMGTSEDISGYKMRFGRGYCTEDLCPLVHRFELLNVECDCAELLTTAALRASYSEEPCVNIFRHKSTMRWICTNLDSGTSLLFTDKKKQGYINK